MKFDFKKINLKQPKYILPLVALLPLLFIGYQITSLISFEKPEDDGMVVKDSLNTDLPDVNSASKKDNKSKYEAMLEGFGAVTDHSAVDGVTREEEITMQLDNVYSDEEARRLDSLRTVREEEAERLKRQLQQQQEEWKRRREANVLSRSEAEGDGRIRDRNAQTTEDEEYDRFVRQMQIVQQVSKGEKIMTEEDKLREAEKAAAAAERRRVLDSIAKAQGPVEVNKAGEGGAQFFNTVSRTEEDPNLIRARVDGVEKVKSGSRIRLRLSEDIEIEGQVVTKGTYLYATVTGFTAQRVMANVTSAKLGNSIKKINLAVYDLDGMEGFYVPSSNFRDMTKDIGSSAMQMNMNMNTTGNMDMESMAMQSLQQALQSTTQAISKNIRTNKARIKSFTEVYLVDMTNK